MEYKKRVLIEYKGPCIQTISAIRKSKWCPS